MRISTGLESRNDEDAFITWVTAVDQKLTVASGDNEELQSKIISLQTTLQVVVKEQQNYRQSQQNYQKQLATLRSQIVAASGSETETLANQIKSLEAQVASLKVPPVSSELTNQLAVLQQEFRSQKAAIEQVVKLNSGLRSQLSGVIAEHERQVQQCSAWQEEFKKQAAEQAKTQSQALIELQTQLSQINIDMQNVINRVKGIEDKHDMLMNKTDPTFTVAQKIIKLRQAILEDKFITNELKYYVAPNGEEQPGLGKPEALYEWTKIHFLDAKAEARVLLVQGQAGAGKSTFNRFLLKNLWQDKAWETYKPGDKAPQAYVPIFIPLGSQQIHSAALLKYLTDIPELIENFTDAELNVLKRDYRLLLIADGYDEMPGQRALNLYDVNQLDRYEGRIKLLIGCRTQRVQEVDELTSLFVPHDPDGKPQYIRFKRRHISPFNETQIRDYLSKYLAQNKDRTDITLWKEVKDYEEAFSRLPELKALITTPFLLLMTIEILPTIVAETSVVEGREGKTTDTKRLTRARVYDYFMESWFKRQAEKVRKAGDTTPAKLLMQQYRQFCLKFAERLRAAGITSVQYPYGEETLFEDDLLIDAPKETVDPQGPRGPWVKKLLGTENEAMTRARQGAPLLIATGNYYQFIHASLIDYFLTTAIAEQARVEIMRAPSTIITKNPEVKAEPVLPVLTDTESSSTEVLLNQGALTSDQVKLLVDRISGDVKLKEILFLFIERSKKESVLAQGAANAITVLNAAEVSFSGMDFNGICIPGADLRGALLDNTQLQQADLTGVNLQQSWMRGANLTGAKMEGVNFGEFPNLEGNVFCQSLDGSLLAAAWSDKSEVYIYDSQTFNLISKLISVGAIKSMAFSENNQYLTVVSGLKPNLNIRLDDYNCYKVSVQSWELKNKKVKWQSNYSIAGGAFMNFAAIKFSPDGKHLALAAPWKDQGYFGADICLMVLDTDYGKPIATQQLLKYQVKGDNIEKSAFLKFSPDGKYLATIGSKGIILFDLNKNTIIFEEKELVCEIFAFSPKGNQIAVVSKSVELWDIDIHQKIHRKKLTNTQTNICSVIFSNDGCLLSVGDAEGNILIYKSDKKEIIRHLKAEKDIRCMTFSPDGQSIATGHQSGSIYVWNVGSGVSREFNGNYDPTKLIFSRSGNYLYSCPNTNRFSQEKIHVWNTSMGINRKLKKQSGHKKAISHIQLNNHNKQIITLSCMNSRLCLWNAETGEKQLFKFKKGLLTSFAGDKRLLVAGTSQIQHSDQGDSIVWIQDLKGTLKHEFRGFWPNNLRFSPDGRWLAWTEGSRDHKSDSVILVDTEKWQRKQIVSVHHHESPLFLHYSDDSVRLIVNISNKSTDDVICYNLAMNKVEGVFSTKKLEGWNGGIVKFTSYKNYLVLYSIWGADNLILIDLNTKKIRKLIAEKGAKLMQCKFSVNGELLVGGSDDGKAIVWDLKKEVNIGKELKTDTHAISKYIGIEEFSPDGRWLITRAVDPALNVVIMGVWDMSAGRCIGTVPIKHGSDTRRYENVSCWSTENLDYYFADVIGTSVRYWKIQITPSNIKASLLWCNEHPFFPFDAIITDAKMSSINACLLRQYGAKGKPAEIIPSETKEEKTDALKKDSFGIRGLAAPATRFGLLATKETPTPANSPVTSPAKTTSPHAKASTSVSRAPAKLTFPI